MIIITGANGFIGSCLLAELESRGYKNLIAVDSVSPTERPELLKKHAVSEFVLSSQLDHFLRNQKSGSIEAIFHMGACSSTVETNVEFLRENNTNYTHRLFEFCTQQSVPYIYASSAATYGDGKNGFDDEVSSQIYRPLNPYGWSKLNFDVWVEPQTKTPPRWAGLKFFNVFGPNEYHKGEMSSVVFKAYYQIRETGKLKLFRSHRPEYADGEQMRDFVYVKDVTSWMIDIWLQRRFSSGIYNMGFGKARTWIDLAKAVFKSMNKEMQIDWIEMPDHVRNQYQYFTEAKMTKLFSQGLTPPQYSLEAGIDDYVKNYLSQSDPYL